MKKPYILGGIAALVIIVVLGGWYAFSNPQLAAAFGMHWGPGPKSGTASSTGMHGMMRGGFASGSIETLNGDGFTLTEQDGTTKTATLTATTTIQYFASASSTPTTITADQLSVGEQVLVMGTPAADGSILATRVMAGTLPARGSYGGMRGGMGSSTGQGGSHRGMGSSTMDHGGMGSGGAGGNMLNQGTNPGGPMQPAQ